MAEPKIKLPFNLFQLNPAEKETKGNKTRLYILIGILFVLIIAAIGINLALQKTTQTDSAPQVPNLTAQQMEKDLVQILPQLERKEEGNLAEQKDYLNGVLDPFSIPMELLGIITGESDLVILKAQQVSYILSLGDKIADTWELTQINRNSIVLKNGTKEIIVELAARK